MLANQIKIPKRPRILSLLFMVMLALPTQYVFGAEAWTTTRFKVFAGNPFWDVGSATNNAAGNIFGYSVFDTEDELVAVATILTMVQKKSPFVAINKDTIPDYLSKLTTETKPAWGKMTPQQMVEHLEYTLRVASGEIQDFEIETPEKILETVHDSIYRKKTGGQAGRKGKGSIKIPFH